MIDPHNDLWQQIEQRLLDRIEQLRTSLENDKNELETSRIRGSIRALREVLNWPKTDAALSAPPESELKFII